jgi:hypothetical protein
VVRLVRWLPRGPSILYTYPPHNSPRSLILNLFGTSHSPPNSLSSNQPPPVNLFTTPQPPPNSPLLQPSPLNVTVRTEDAPKALHVVSSSAAAVRSWSLASTTCSGVARPSASSWSATRS